jgi:hypothetical protein
MLFDNDSPSGGEGLNILELIGWIIVIFMMFKWFVQICNWLGFKVGGC